MGGVSNSAHVGGRPSAELGGSDGRPSVGSLLGDLSAEQAEVRAIVTGLDASAWELPTTPGWNVRDQIAHLAFFDDSAATSISNPSRFAEEKREALADIDAYERRHLLALPPCGEQVLESWAAAAARFIHAAEQADPRARAQWFGPDMGLLSMITSRLMETWAHGQDVADALDVRRQPAARLRHIADLAVRARPTGYLIRDLAVPAEPVRVELAAPRGATWSFRPEDATHCVSGAAEEFCLVLVRRRHVDDTALVCEGELAREWMEIGQAYAGPPGEGPKRLTQANANEAS